MIDIWDEPDPDANRDQRFQEREWLRERNGYYDDPQNDEPEEEDGQDGRT